MFKFAVFEIHYDTGPSINPCARYINMEMTTVKATFHFYIESLGRDRNKFNLSLDDHDRINQNLAIKIY